MSSVEIKGISKHFDDTVALSEVNLKIPDGTYVVLLGPSGSGKTTMLMILGGFESPTTGSVLFDNRDVTHLSPAKRPTATVFQDYALFPHMSVTGNIKFGLSMQGVPRPERERRAESILEMVGLVDMGNRRIHQLSGGQRQRVALARSLVVDPDVLLLDEPLGALDLNLRKQMQDELKAIQHRVGTTFIHVTHDQDEAMSIADLIVVLNHGKIEDIGPPSRVYLKPASCFTATFMGDNNLFDGTIRESNGEFVLVDTIFGALQIPKRAFTDTPPLNREIKLGLRPEQITALENSTDRVNHSTQFNMGRAKLQEHTFVGTHHVCNFIHEESGLLIKARLPQRAQVAVGQYYTLAALLTDIVGLMK